MTDRFEDKVVITGLGQSALGRRLGRDDLDLTAAACLAAVEDAGLSVRDIDGLASFPGAADLSRRSWGRSSPPALPWPAGSPATCSCSAR